MSSFVISRTDYAKAAGFIAGLADPRLRDNAIYLWDYSRNRRYTPEDFKPAFRWLYALNLKSVSLQYGDAPEDWEIEEDPDEIEAMFKTYRSAAVNLYMFKPRALVEAIREFRRFCHSVLYQIEDKECERLAKGFLFRLCFALDDLESQAAGQELVSWGDFKIPTFSA